MLARVEAARYPQPDCTCCRRRRQLRGAGRPFLSHSCTTVHVIPPPRSPGHLDIAAPLYRIECTPRIVGWPSAQVTAGGESMIPRSATRTTAADSPGAGAITGRAG